MRNQVNASSGLGETTPALSVFSSLSALDGVYLSSESPDAPLHIACLVFLDAKALITPTGRVRVAAIRRHIEQQWSSNETVHVRLKPKTKESEPHTWEHVRDVQHCVQVVKLPVQSDDRAVLNWCATALSPMLPRDQPLWRIYILSGISKGRIGLLFQMHHALSDGQGAAALLRSLLDGPADPVADKTVAETRGNLDADPTEAAEFPEELEATLTSRIEDGIHQLFDLARKGVDVAKQGINLAEGVAFLATSTGTRPQTSLNQSVTSQRQLDSATVPLDTVRELAHKLGVTLNDIVLAMVTGALREMLKGRGEDVSELSLEALVPVSMRFGKSNDSGNQTAVLQVPLPVWEDRALERVRQIHRSTQDRKHRHAAEAVSVLESVASFVPFSLLDPIAKLSVRHQNLVNIVITNLRGPVEPLSFMGARVLRVVPFLPLAPNLPLSVAIGSYGPMLEIGVQSNSDACPDAPVFIQHLVEELATIGRS